MKQIFLTAGCVGLVIGLIGKITDSPLITKIGLLILFGGYFYLIVKTFNVI